MGKFIEQLIDLLFLLKVFLSFMAFLYLYVWAIQFYDPELYLLCDRFIGHLPAAVDKIYSTNIDLFGVDAKSGYVFLAGALVIFCIVDIKVIDLLDSLLVHVRNCDIKRELEKRLGKSDKKKKKKKNEERALQYYALLELNMQKTITDKNFDYKATRLKKDYSKKLVNKLSQKYPKLQFIVSDKVFVIGNDFSQIMPMLNDIKTLFKVFYDINNKKMIETKLSLSFWCKFGEKDTERANKILGQINKQHFNNKVIFSASMLDYFPEEEKKKLNFIPLGWFNLSGVNQNDSDLELELYHLLLNHY